MLFTDLLFFMLSCAGLAVSGHFVVKSLIKVARFYHLREFVVGFVLMAVMTSMPELFVGIMSALSGFSGISLGDILGANIVNLTIVVGITSLLGKRIKIESEIEKRDVFYTALIAMLPIFLFIDNGLSRFDGILLVGSFFLYLFRLISQRSHFRKIMADHISRKMMEKEVVLFVFSLFVLLLSARFVVEFAIPLVSELSLSPLLIGLTIVSIGTTLPELFFNTNSVLKGHYGMAMGDLLGSVVANSSLVLGIVCIISPIEASIISFTIASGFLALVLTLFIIFSKTEREITWKEGVVLLMLYFVFVITSLIFR
ncbi:MAG: sodium:calcium antiporter [Candidatus Aenigmarchaeota archaeon]|nr:sodium:calcium antiporter [Candidatus Aenigmarchaeota archaeon]